MKKFTMLFCIVCACSIAPLVRVSGNASISQQGGNAIQNKNAAQNERPIVRDKPLESPSPDGHQFFIDANILMNVKADEYVAVFNVAQEGKSADECNQKVDSRISEFTNGLKSLNIGSDDVFVDFTTQNKIYDFSVSGETAKEKSLGFEVKKNVLIHYKDPNLTDKLIVIAAKSSIFDLVKVDYAIKDTGGVKNKLLEEASKVVKEKEARYGRLFGIKLRTQLQIETEKYHIYYPTEMYSSYTAFETGKIGSGYNVQEARKSKTYYFNPLGADGFDYVVNPVVVEPIVQFTVYLRIKYEIDR